MQFPFLRVGLVISANVVEAASHVRFQEPPGTDHTSDYYKQRATSVKFPPMDASRTNASKLIDSVAISI